MRRIYELIKFGFFIMDRRVSIEAGKLLYGLQMIRRLHMGDGFNLQRDVLARVFREGCDDVWLRVAPH